MKIAFVTLLIGAKFQSRWEANCKSSWLQYCRRHHYDLFCLTDPLDVSDRAKQRSPAWQKCLILGQEKIKDYDRVIWIDSDIVINANAPCILAQGIPEDKIAGVDNLLKVKIGREIAVALYQAAGLPAISDKIMNTGVMVMSPKNHRSILEHVYFNYEQGPFPYFEQIPLCFEILKDKLEYWIDPKFNCFVSDVFEASYPFLSASTLKMPLLVRIKRKLIRMLFCRLCLEAALEQTWFLHYAGYAKLMDERNFWGRLE